MAASDAYKRAGMFYDGLTYDWEAAKRFIDSSHKTLSQVEQRWDNGIGPIDYSELADKTFIGAVVVETGLDLPMKYFLDSSEWELLEKRSSAAVFVRKAVQR